MKKTVFLVTVGIVSIFYFLILNMERPGVMKEAVLVFRTAENHILELFRLDEVKGFSFPCLCCFFICKNMHRF